MDQRSTLNRNDKFDVLLLEILNNGEPARLLYDDNGLQRAEGKIRELHLQSERPFLILEDGRKIFTEHIIGLNAVFKDDYSAC